MKTQIFILILLIFCMFISGCGYLTDDNANDNNTAVTNSATKESVGESMVWIPTNGGTKYHLESTCSNMKNPERVSLSKAQSLGFTACKKCY